jgi:hypothetical protein
MDRFPDFSLVGQKGVQHRRNPQGVDHLLPLLKFMPVDQSQSLNLRIFLLPVLHHLFRSSPARIMNTDNPIHKGGDPLENFSYQFLPII